MTEARASRVRLVGVAIGAGVAVVFACLSVGATAAPAPFLLTFDGAHPVDTTLPHGLRHDGRFTASAPFCSAGRAYDVGHSTDEGGFLNVLRIHTCDDGSGSFTADMPTVRGEHGGTGSWRILEGTGRYATLRGLGTYTGTLISGDPECVRHHQLQDELAGRRRLRRGSADDRDVHRDAAQTSPTAPHVRVAGRLGGPRSQCARLVHGGRSGWTSSARLQTGLDGIRASNGHDPDPPAARRPERECRPHCHRTLSETRRARRGRSPCDSGPRYGRPGARAAGGSSIDARRLTSGVSGTRTSPRTGGRGRR